ncbi:MAG TPA: carbohydrate ABC transporter permease [Firmicutes bacterium]|nr:carbohydrate ABC transporter permease [Bacillota bacterium]
MLKRQLNRSIWGNFLLFLVLAAGGLFTSLPFLYAISNAFKPLDQLYLFPPPLLVTNPTTEHFVQLAQLASDFWVPLSRYIFNSLFVSVTATVGHVFLSSMAAYPLAKDRFPGKRVIQKVIVMSLLFTGAVTQLPQYIVMSRLQILNTYAALILPMFMSSLGLYLMQNFMVQIPDSMLEAARIDGAGEWRIYWSVVMPNCRPAWLTLTIFAFQQIWNNNGNLYIYSEELKGLPSILSSIAAGGSGIARAGVSAAASLLILIPPVVIFLITQGSVVETMTTSGLKE